MGKRRYSDDERAACLAALAANAGNLTKTAREVGVPRQTLQSWASGAVHPEAAEHSAGKKADLAELFGRFVERVLVLTTDEDIRAAPLGQRFTAAGIATDKKQLLTGKPTSINRNENVDDLTDDDLADIARAGRDGTAAKANGQAHTS